MHSRWPSSVSGCLSICVQPHPQIGAEYAVSLDEQESQVDSLAALEGALQEVTQEQNDPGYFRHLSIQVGWWAVQPGRQHSNQLSAMRLPLCLNSPVHPVQVALSLTTQQQHTGTEQRSSSRDAHCQGLVPRGREPHSWSKAACFSKFPCTHDMRIQPCIHPTHQVLADVILSHLCPSYYYSRACSSTTPALARKRRTATWTTLASSACALST